MNSNLLNLAYKLNNFNNQFIKSKFKIIDSKSVKSNIFDYIQVFILNKEFEKISYRDLLLNYFINAEKVYPGLSLLVSVILVQKIFNKEKVKNEKLIDKDIDNLIRYFYKIAPKKVVDNFVNILNFSGPDASLNCNLTKNKDFTVYKNNNPLIKNIYLNPDLINVYFGNVKETTKNIQMSIIDGYIERESEIIPLLDKAKMNNLSSLIICRGISDYAIQQIKRIILKNNIHVYIYEAKFDNNDPFLIDDISELTGVNKLSSDTCDNIYKDVVEKSKVVKAKLTAKSLEFFNTSKSLNEKINKSIAENLENSDLLKYLYLRKKRISPNVVDISIPFDQYKDFKIYKKLIACYNLCAIKGFIELEEKIFSKYEIDNARAFANKLYDAISSIGVIIKNV